MPQLVPDGSLDLPGVRIRSVGVSARVDADLADPGTVRGLRDLGEQISELGMPSDGARVLGEALAAGNLHSVLTVPMDDLTTTLGGGTHRGLDGEPAVELTVGTPGADEAQVLLEVDGTGVVSWHFAEATGPAGFRAGLEEVFRIPIRQADIPGAEPTGGADRGLFGIGAKKLLQVLRYPVESAAAAVGNFVVSRWEHQARPYGLRLLDGGTPNLAALAGLPTLLLVHGTFSTCASGFGGLLDDEAFLAEVRSRYDSRVLVFDHPSVHVDPTENARWLFGELPPDADLLLDVVTHSRGGLVSRALASGAVAADADRRPVTLRTAIHVGTPNAGTVLADPERWGALLDIVTNLLTLFPDDTVSVPLTAVIETVKQIGTGVVGGLDGLAAMVPYSPWLSDLAPPAVAGRTYAVASDFEPVSAALPMRALKVLTDPFFGEDNGLVVPTKGVSEAPGFTADELLMVPHSQGVVHTTYFRDQDVRTKIAEWLPPAG